MAGSPTFHPLEGSEPIPGYVLERLLGRGGFGEVWQAKSPGGFHVAVKFIKLDTAAGKLENRSIALLKQLRHGNLITIFDAQYVGDYLAQAMELADRSLSDRFKEAQEQGLPGIPRDELLEYLFEAAKGLDYLNAPRHTVVDKRNVGIQHRDIKPDNILLVGDTVKVADFGLARLLEGSVTGHTGSMSVTYAAPEFFQDQTSNRSDQYSLAVTYYHLRTGSLPFAASSMQAMVLCHLQKPPDLSLVPDGERQALERALAKEPRERFETCRQLVEGLRSVKQLVAVPHDAITPPPFHAVRPPAVEQHPPEPAVANETDPTPAAKPGIDTAPIKRQAAGRAAGRSLLLVAGAAGLLAVASGVYQFLDSLPRGSIPKKTLAVGDNDVPKTNDESTQPEVKKAEATPSTSKSKLATKQEELPEAKVGKMVGEPFKSPPKSQGEEGDAGEKKIEKPRTELKNGEPLPGRNKTAPATLTARFPPAKAKEMQQAWAEYLGVPVERKVNLGNGVEMAFVLIPPGTFQMGSPQDEVERGSDENRHEVVLTKPYYLGKYEVVQEEYESIIGKNPSLGVGKRRPVEQVSWEEAVAFCESMKKKTGLVFRLPTEAEWEFACRAGTSSAFHFGPSLSSVQANFDGTKPYGGAAIGENHGSTREVGFYQPNAFGLYDMHGNVGEWCSDWFANDYPAGDATDPTGPTMAGENPRRVFRGGSTNAAGSWCRSAQRIFHDPSKSLCIIGFRPVLVVSPP